MFHIMLADEGMRDEVQQLQHEYEQELSASGGASQEGSKDASIVDFDAYWEDVEERYPLLFLEGGKPIGLFLLRHDRQNERFFILTFHLRAEYRTPEIEEKAVEKLKGFCLSVEKNPVLESRIPEVHPYGHDFWKQHHFIKSTNGEGEMTVTYGTKV